MINGFRAPSYPLVTVDPYFSVWSPSDELYGSNTVHWTNEKQAMVGIIKIDGRPYRFLGKITDNLDNTENISQKSVTVKPLSTEYVFEGKGIRLTVNFTTPLLLDDLYVLSRPASYISFNVSSLDETPHNIEIYFDVTGEWCVNSSKKKVTWRRQVLSNNSKVMIMSQENQQLLNCAKDDIRIDWGYFYLAVPKSNLKCKTLIQSHEIRHLFLANEESAEKKIYDYEDLDKVPKTIEEDMTVMSAIFNLEKVGIEPVSTFVVLAYDDIKSIEYLTKQLPALWRRTNDSFEEMLIKAIDEYTTLMKRCKDFNESLIDLALQAGGKEYADILSLSYRQAIAAHKAVYDEEDGILFFSKECFSNGCIATVDITYPSLPLFLLYNTELAKGMLKPIFRYYNTDAWKFNFAPHDVGTYPIANGQKYGDNKLEYQMPVEECGNMLIATAAICKAEGKPDFASEHFEALTDWAKYLVESGFDPSNQLCTDDFAGHLAHNTNLSIKAILGIASYSLICKMLKKDSALEYLNIAKDLAEKWKQIALRGDHFALTFDSEESWSQKYNLVWDTLLDLNIFDKEISKKEIDFYLKVSNKYGIPLDSRATYTKADWIAWCASMAENTEDFAALIKPVWLFINETPNRVPFNDWYDTVSGRQHIYMTVHGKAYGFQNRTVVGGMFMKLLKDKFNNIAKQYLISS